MFDAIPRPDANRILASVGIRAAAGKKVEFGPKGEGNFVQTSKTIQKVFLERINGVYVAGVFFLVAGK